MVAQPAKFSLVQEPFARRLKLSDRGLSTNNMNSQHLARRLGDLIAFLALACLK